MALGVSWDIARSGLSTASEQIALVSRNVANVQNPDATRRQGELVPREGGGVRMASIERVASRPLLETLLGASGDAAMHSAVLESAGKLSAIIGDPELGQSPAALIAKLESGLRAFAARPSDPTVGRAALADAETLATALNAASRVVSKVRDDADRAIAASVAKVNSLLGSLEEANTEIVRLTGGGSDITDLLDRRDSILKQLSSEVGTRVVARPGNDVLVYTDSGIVLFETVARPVTFAASSPLAPGAAGGALYIDGVEATGPSSVMPIGSGRLRGLFEARDVQAPIAGAQLDEIARGLIEAFADPDLSGGGGPSLPGLFTWSAGTVPPGATLIPGLAASIRVNPGIDPAQGGSITYLRDGGASAPGNPAYSANPAGAAGFSARLDALVASLSAGRDFDGVAGLQSRASLLDYASASGGWIEEGRRSASDASDKQEALRARAAELLHGTTGVNIDREMTDMLNLERAYQASSRLISTIDAMFDALFGAMR